jgi:hypothetical protein
MASGENYIGQRLKKQIYATSYLAQLSTSRATGMVQVQRSRYDELVSRIKLQYQRMLSPKCRLHFIELTVGLIAKQREVQRAMRLHRDNLLLSAQFYH